ncbi:MAG: hypothetical protein V7L01_09725 [Nostoc sp.]|uniref:hypothetical protein n=1 Tax=Nostoc sp. TaxID=1180 RepID=UPI002FF7397C
MMTLRLSTPTSIVWLQRGESGQEAIGRSKGGLSEYQDSDATVDTLGNKGELSFHPSTSL